MPKLFLLLSIDFLTNFRTYIGYQNIDRKKFLSGMASDMNKYNNAFLIVVLIFFPMVYPIKNLPIKNDPIKSVPENLQVFFTAYLHSEVNKMLKTLPR